MDDCPCADPTAQIQPKSLRPVADRLPEATRGANQAPENRSTLITAALLEGQTEALLRTAFQLAGAGNVPMLKFVPEPHNAPRPTGQTRSAPNDFRRRWRGGARIASCARLQRAQ